MSFILYQHNQCHVTQPLILESLREWGIDISSGQVNRILTEKKDSFHKEKDDLLSTALENSPYLNVDDTGARHAGKNGYCTHIGNEFFAWFSSSHSKSRINFLKLLSAGPVDYVLNEEALQYMRNLKFPKNHLSLISTSMNCTFDEQTDWEEYLKSLGIRGSRHIQIATEGALMGSLLFHGLPKSLVIVSDDAGQFNILNHALCWIHAERTINKIIPHGPKNRQALKEVRDQIWTFYTDLKAYKEAPTPTLKEKLEKRFDTIFTATTNSTTLNSALRRLHKNKKELLLVLERPEIPLHNNLSENDIREYVTRRKISGGTRSDLGRQARDTFTSLKKTTRKLGISFWGYLKDRISKTNQIPALAQIMAQQMIASN